jgi:hypothetical protein
LPTELKCESKPAAAVTTNAEQRLQQTLAAGQAAVVPHMQHLTTWQIVLELP